MGIGVLAVVAIATYFLFFGKTEEDKIRETVERLAKVVEIKEGANPLFRAAGIRDELAKLVTDDVRVEVSELGSARTGIQGVAEVAAQAQLGFLWATAELRHVEVKLEPGANTAQVGAEAQLRGKTRSGETRRDDRNVDFFLRKEDGTWKVKTVTVWAPH